MHYMFHAIEQCGNKLRDNVFLKNLRRFMKFVLF